MNKSYIFLTIAALAVLVAAILMIGRQNAGVEDGNSRGDIIVQIPESGEEEMNKKSTKADNAIEAELLEPTGDVDETISSLTKMSAREDAIFNEETADANFPSDVEGALNDLENSYDENEIQ